MACSSEGVAPVPIDSSAPPAAPSGASAPAERDGMAPRMPKGWAIVQDDAIVGPELARIEGQLCAKLKTLRNTVYQVNDNRVQINMLIAVDAESAEAATTFLTSLKPSEFVLRKDLTIYEFVCTNAAIPDARAGRQHLAAQ